MDVRLRFEFNNGDLRSGFDIINPPVIPIEGDMIDFAWEKYIDDQEQLTAIRNIAVNECFIANVFLKTYSPTEVKILVIIFEETDYELFQLRQKEDLIKRQEKFLE